MLLICHRFYPSVLYLCCFGFKVTYILPHITSVFDVCAHGHRILFVKEGEKRQILDEAMRGKTTRQHDP
jgi:hypothetical protein